MQAEAVLSNQWGNFWKHQDVLVQEKVGNLHAVVKKCWKERLCVHVFAITWKLWSFKMILEARMAVAKDDWSAWFMFAKGAALASAKTKKWKRKWHANQQKFWLWRIVHESALSGSEQRRTRTWQKNGPVSSKLLRFAAVLANGRRNVWLV